jgi:hypothetical protein
MDNEQTALGKFNAYILELNKKRAEAAEAHRAYVARSTSPFAEIEGNTDIYALAMQIEGAVELAKKIGLVDSNKKPTDFLK